MNRFSTTTILFTALIFGTSFMGASCAQKQVAAAPETAVPPVAAVGETAPMPETQVPAEAVVAEEAVTEPAAEEKLEQERQVLEDKAAEQARFVDGAIAFEFDSARLSQNAKELLRERAAWMAANPDVTVTIEGHCDVRGTEPYNQNLGQERAAAVKAYLVKLGIVSDRLACVSYGESQPLSSGEEREDHEKNRRAMFKIETGSEHASAS